MLGYKLVRIVGHEERACSPICGLALPCSTGTHAQSRYVKGESSLRLTITRLPEHVRVDVK